MDIVVGDSFVLFSLMLVYNTFVLDIQVLLFIIFCI